ncbi:MAG: Txe/YoeB family addiction module toxin [Clostridiales Family XIII bacterium]|jgi:toxin YoeB|nr:Txe/YoeB family addiction module toxin [Clostridiales Family XIII bacterium]
MKLNWHEKAWRDYLYWQNQDRRTLKKINNLIRDIERQREKPIGQSEKLKGDLSGISSSRIDEKNRLLWFAGNDVLEIISCRGHCKDK